MTQNKRYLLLERFALAIHASLFSCLLFSLPALALASFTGPVVSVLDGDTIEVLHNTRPERICLSGIDCPEKERRLQRGTLCDFCISSQSCLLL